MILQIRFSLIFCCLAAVLCAQQPITLEDCFSDYRFYPEPGPNLRFMADGIHYVQQDKGNIVRYDVRTGKADSTLATKDELNVPFDEYQLSENELFIILQANTEPVYRHSFLADYYVFDLTSRRLKRINETGGKLQCLSLSPDGNSVAYVQHNNLYYKDLNNYQVTPITSDGEPNKIINGLADWVYEEEFSPVTGDGMAALKWSPDGKRIAFLRFNESQVPTMRLTWYENGPYPNRTEFKYPKVGQPNSVVSAHIFDLKNNQLADCGEVKRADDDYIVRLNWASNFNLVATRLNRLQDTLDLVLLTPGFMNRGVVTKYESELLLRETDAAYVEVHDNLRFLQNGRQYIWSSERDGYNHLYLYDFIEGNLIRPLTSGTVDVTTFYGIDEKNGKFYYQTASPTPMDRQLWEGDLGGGAPRLLVTGSGTHEAQFSPSFDYFIHQWSDMNTPSVVTLRNRKGEVERTFTDNARARKAREAFGLTEKTFWSFPLADGTRLNGWMLRPPAFDSTRRYPVLFDIYGGPGSQTVQNQYDGFIGGWHQMLAQKGYIIVSVDNRGTGGRGRDFKKITQLELGKYETEDQIAAARYLARQPWVDSARIGIWGWSFGGYLSSSCVLKGNDVFKMAIAVAPVTNWKWYDSAYTERYMHTTSDNEKGYRDNSPIYFADRLRGGNYLICHGIADDNVHWQQTVEMINALIRAGKQFETYSYPNRDHGIYGENATRHLFTKLTSFILEQL